MLFMDVRALNGADRAYARYWNHVHSVERALAGVKLALWLRTAPSIPRESSEGIVVELGWPVAPDQFQHVRITLDAAALQAFAWGLVDAVALARFELPNWVHDLIERKLGYSAKLPGQVNGWWTDEAETPRWRPSGALLPPRGEPLADGQDCLVLVDLDDWWGVLSGLGLGSYTFASRLESGETVAFLDESGRRWAVRRLDDIDPADVRTRWGAQAAERARPGVGAVRVRVSSIN
jgi:hypothetical protein